MKAQRQKRILDIIERYDIDTQEALQDKLREEGFGDGSMSLAKDFLDGTDFASVCAEHISKKYGRVPSDEHERKLMYASLARMGFSATDIKRAMKLI